MYSGTKGHEFCWPFKEHFQGIVLVLTCNFIYLMERERKENLAFNQERQKSYRR